MALVPCVDCGKEISTLAVSCPNCGRPSDVWQETPLEIVSAPQDQVADTDSSKVANDSHQQSVEEFQIESGPRCPNCEDLIDITHKPTNCMKCGFSLPESYSKIKLPEGSSEYVVEPDVPDEWTMRAFRIAAAFLFSGAAVGFVINAAIGKVPGSSSNNYSVLVSILIGIGLLRQQGLFRVSQDGYRKWAVIGSIVGPILAMYEISGTRRSGNYIYYTPFFVVVPDILVSIGFLTLLFDPPVSRVRVIAGSAITIFGFIGIGILLYIVFGSK